MKLTNLKLTNFQGIRSLEISSPTGGDIVVRGENGTGKTTIANAVSWLLFGKPATGEKAYNPKTVDADGTEIHHLHHSARGRFLLENGEVITLEKDFYEIWQKVRGRSVEAYKGNSVDYYVDGVPVKEKEYSSRLAEVFDPEVALMLTLPDHFAQTMSWQTRREILLQVCGDYGVDEIVAAEPELEVLAEKLRKGDSEQRYTVDDFAKIAASAKKATNEALKILPARIDEADKAIDKTVEELSVEELEATSLELKTRLSDAEMRLKSATNADADADTERRRQIASLTAELQELQNAANAASAANQAAAIKATMAATAIYEAAQSEYRQLHSAVLETARAMNRMEEEREQLLIEYKEEQAKQWSGTEICPTCGQRMPAEEVEKSKAEFNRKRSERLMRINERGKGCSKDAINALSAELGRLQTQMQAKAVECETKKAEIEGIKAGAVAIHPEETEAMKLLKSKIADLSEEKAPTTNRLSEREKALRDEICCLDETLRENEKKIAIKASNDSQKRRIAELEAEEKQLAAKYEEAEYDVYLADLFARTKARLLDERVNSKFKSVRFNLFETQINGGQVDACTVLVQTTEGLKPYAKANTGAKIHAAIEIMDTLGKHYGVQLPIIIDNAEAVTGEIEKTAAQKILLYAAEGAKALKIKTL